MNVKTRIRNSKQTSRQSGLTHFEEGNYLFRCITAMTAFHRTETSLFFTADVANTSFPPIFLVFPATSTPRVPHLSCSTQWRLSDCRHDFSSPYDLTCSLRAGYAELVTTHQNTGEGGPFCGSEREGHGVRERSNPPPTHTHIEILVSEKAAGWALLFFMLSSSS